MAVSSPADSPTLSPLEQFVRDQVETIGGAWDEIEPQVYDILLPADATEGAANRPASMLRVAFDPEALSEHPQAQLASLGTPLIDALLTGALERGRFVRLHLLGLNLHPHQLAGQVARTLKLAEGLSLAIRQLRALDFPQLVLWFEATFIADQREQEILPVAIDLHSGRQVRHLDLLLNESRLSETPSETLPEAPTIGRAAAYRIAREQVLRTIASLANVRARELSDRLGRQVARMRGYYDDLRQELEDQAARTAARGDDAAKFQSRRAALVHERDLRIAELERKNALRAQLRLLNVLLIHQPKLQLRADVLDKRVLASSPAASVSLVWDPLAEMLEPAACAVCKRPTFELARRQSGLVCPACLSLPPPARRPAHK